MLSMISGSSNTASSVLSTSETESLVVEKKNLINIFKLAVKDLIEISFQNTNRHIDKQSAHLIYFYDIFENIISHGYQGKKGGFGLGFLSRNKDFTVLLDVIASKCDSGGCFSSIKDMSEIKTSIGKIRAWIRLSIMQKKLSENFARLMSEKDLIKELYAADSVVMSDEAAMISGILVGLNALDIAVDLRSELGNLDLPLRSVNYSIYLREKLPDLEEADENDSFMSEQKINEIFDQKNYLEEINKKLELKVEQLQNKVQTLEKTNLANVEKTASLKNENSALRIELDGFKIDKQNLEDELKTKIESVYNDIKVEREAFSSSKSGLDQMYIELQKKFLDETKLRSSVEAELQTQIILKNEQDAAFKLVEESLKDKHEIINILRDQLEQVKSINLDLVNETQKNETEYKRRAKEVDELTESLKLSQEETNGLYEKLESTEALLKQKEQICKNRLDELEMLHRKLNELEKDFVIEKNWRAQVQKDLEEKEKELTKAWSRIDELAPFEQKCNSLHEENQLMKDKIRDLEVSLEEMGSKLGVTHLNMEDFKEVTRQIHEFQWEQDEHVSVCKPCGKEFNVARRKHHCRRCGRIFCNECSDNKMALPSSSKPVRVCNNCYQHLIQKSTLVNK